jgi:ribosomal protein S18 acetylase RimI-like enzyme
VLAEDENGLKRINIEEAIAFEGSLVELLVDAVDSGASIGFLPPLPVDEALAYWRSVFDAMRSGGRILIVAGRAGRVMGSVQLGLEERANGRHRAEVMKLMVHRNARGCGIGRALMEYAHSVAREAGRSLLVLDTRLGDAAEQLYYKLGYAKAGVIPGYARSASGSLDDTVILYLKIGPGSE